VADQDLRYVITVVDRATAELARLTGTIDTLARTAESLNKKMEEGSEDTQASLISLNQGIELVQKGFSLLGAAIEFPIAQFSSLLSISTDLVREYDVQAQAEVRLASALTASGDAAEGTAESLIEYASALQQTTRFGDEAIVATEAVVASFVRGDANIQRATKAALDLSSAFGIDLQSAALKVATAVETGELAIGRMKVKLTESKDPADRLNTALTAIESRFGGLSEKLANVGAGPLDQLQNAISDFRETIGDLISKTPEFLAFIDTSKEMLASLQAFAKNNSSDLIIAFGRAFELSFKLASASVEAIVQSVDKLTKVVVAIGEAFWVFRDQDEVREELGETGKALDELTKKRGILEGELAKPSVQKNIELFLGFQTSLNLVNNDIATLTGKVSELKTELGELEHDPFAEMKKSASELATEITGLVEQFEQGFEKNLEKRRAETPEAQRAAFGQRLEGIDQALGEAGLIGILDPMVQAQKAAAERLEKAAEELGLTAGIATQLATAESLRFLEVLGTFNGSLDQWKELRALESTILNQFDTGIKAFGTAVEGLDASSIKLGVSAGGLDMSAAGLSLSASSLGFAADGLSAAGQDLNGASGSLDRAADALEEAANALQQGGGGEGLPQLAAGGILRRPTKVIGGEAGPEAIIPLNEEGARFAARAFGLGGAGISVGSINISARNLSLSPQGLDATFNAFDRKLADSLQRARRMKSGSLGA
jgi:hypothetical protein